MSSSSSVAGTDMEGSADGRSDVLGSERALSSIFANLSLWFIHKMSRSVVFLQLTMNSVPLSWIGFFLRSIRFIRALTTMYLMCTLYARQNQPLFFSSFLLRGNFTRQLNFWNFWNSVFELLSFSFRLVLALLLASAPASLGKGEPLVWLSSRK